jgi:uncharacterized protein
MLPYQLTPKGYILSIRVTPKAFRDKVGDLYCASDGNVSLKIYVTAVAEDNKANQAVVALIAKVLRIAKSDIQIVSGQKDRQKTLLLPERVSMDLLLPASSRQGSLF